MLNSDIWVLGDNRVGNTNQAIALANNLNDNYEIKYLKYNFMGALPNSILMLFPLHLNGNLLKKLEDSPPPKLIISAGRRTAAVAIYLKRKFLNTKFIQIMNPGGFIDKFDLVILPQHDAFYKNTANVLKIIGAFSNIHHKVDEQSTNFHKYYPDAKKFIAVIIGGDNKVCKFSLENAVSLNDILLKLAENHPIPFFFSFSRRTPQFLKQLIRNNFLWPHTIYDPQEGGYNPYFDILKNADYIICTGDSISMCSEAATTGKPLYIYGPTNLRLKKHKFFVQQLVDLGIARALNLNVHNLDNYSYSPLNEVAEIAKFIKQNILSIKN